MNTARNYNANTLVKITIKILRFSVSLTIHSHDIYVSVLNYALELPFSPPFSSPQLFQNIGEFGAKKYFADRRTANTIQLFVAINISFSGLFFFWTSRSKEQFPMEYLINITTCLFPCH